MRFIFQRWNTSCVHNSEELCLEVSQSIDCCLHILSMSFDFIKTFVNMLSEVCGSFWLSAHKNHYGKRDLVLYGKQDLFLFSLINFCQYAFIDSWFFFQKIVTIKIIISSDALVFLSFNSQEVLQVSSLSCWHAIILCPISCFISFVW